MDSGLTFDTTKLGWWPGGLIASSELKDQVLIGSKIGNEVGLEAYYNFAITPWLQFSLMCSGLLPASKLTKMQSFWVRDCLRSSCITAPDTPYILKEY